jgi:Xaa-Pro aminopeptidase
MKPDIDALMQTRNLDALIILGDAQNNPPMVYFTGGGHINNAILIKLAGKEAVLFCNDMEREEGYRTGLQVHCFSEFPFEDLLKEAKGDHTLAGALRIKLMLTSLGLVTGIVSLYGQTDFGSFYAIFKILEKIMPEIEFIGEPRDASIFLIAMETKDLSEVSRIRQMGRITTTVVGKVADYLTNCEVDENEILILENRSSLTIGDVKGKINLWLAELGVENPHGTIFSIGHDAGVPHSTGNPTDLIRLGQTIVFDIYPCEAGGGYHYDFTRTWCLGYAPAPAINLYNQVFAAYQKVFNNLDLNAPYKDYQRLVCDMFEADGHPTPQTQKSPMEGYVHSLGHGVGLNIHERPWSGLSADDDNRLKAGVVATIEPGLYYPNDNLGVRLEDTFWVDPDGKFEILAQYPLDLVLPMKKWKRKI